MRKFLSFGDGVPLTTVTLLVLGPVLFGLALIAFYPVFDASWWIDLLRRPAKHALLIFWLLLFLRWMVEPATQNEDQPGERFWTGLIRTADLLWAMAAGMLLCLAIVVEKDTVDTTNQNITVCMAVG